MGSSYELSSVREWLSRCGVVVVVAVAVVEGDLAEALEGVVVIPWLLNETVLDLSTGLVAMG